MSPQFLSNPLRKQTFTTLLSFSALIGASTPAFIRAAEPSAPSSVQPTSGGSVISAISAVKREMAEQFIDEQNEALVRLLFQGMETGEFTPEAILTGFKSEMAELENAASKQTVTATLPSLDDAKKNVYRATVAIDGVPTGGTESDRFEIAREAGKRTSGNGGTGKRYSTMAVTTQMQADEKINAVVTKKAILAHGRSSEVASASQISHIIDRASGKSAQTVVDRMSLARTRYTMDPQTVNPGIDETLFSQLRSAGSFSVVRGETARIIDGKRDEELSRRGDGLLFGNNARATKIDAHTAKLLRKCALRSPIAK